MLVHRQKNNGKLTPKQNLCFSFLLKGWKDLLERHPCFSGLLRELVLVTGVVTPRVNDFEGCNSELSGSSQHRPGLQINIKARGGLHRAVQRNTVTSV